MSALAIDLGGTRIKIGLVDGGAILGTEVIPAHSSAGLAQALPRIEQAVARLAAATHRDPRGFDGLAMGFPGIVSRRDARVLAIRGKYMDADGIDLAAWCRAAWGIPFHIENDARLAGIAEWRYGAGRGCDNLAALTLGTGIGVCVVAGGRIVRGPHGTGGILGGHMTLDLNGPRCVCGNIGCAEALASNHVIDRQARAAELFASSALAGPDRVDYRAVFTHARGGDRLAQDLVGRALDVWAALCVSLVHACDLERIVLGGGIMKSADLIVAPLTERVMRHAWTPWGRVEVRPSELGDHAALLAAEWLVHEQPGM